MSNESILSPEEKDSLLEEIDKRPIDSTGTYVGTDGTPYNFASPSHNLLSSVPRIEQAVELFCEKFGANVSRLIRHHAEIDQEELKTPSLNDFMSSLPPVAYISFCKIPPLNGYALFVVESLLLHICVDRYFGGEGEAKNFSESKKYSPPAAKLVAQMNEGFLVELKESLADIIAIEPFQEYSNSSPELASLPIENEDVAQFTFNIGFAGTSGACHLLIPFSLVKEIKAHIESEGDSASQVVDTNWRNAIEATLQQTQVELKAIALEKKIPLGDLVGIKVGDLFPIGPLGDVTLKVGKVELAVGVAGTAEGQNAVQITQTRLA